MLPDPRHDDAPEAAELPEGMTTLAQALAAILPGLRAALDRQANPRPRIEPMTLRIEEVADALGVSRRAIERERAAGRFPKPALHVGKMPLWSVATIREWLDKGGGRA